MSQDNFSSDDSKSSGRDEEDEVIESGPSEITFEKRIVPRQRTQSIQSVLSSVSLKSLAQQGSRHTNNSNNRKQPFMAPQQSSQPQFINTKTHIQAPAIAASSKRRASFEIGQKFPFNPDEAEHESDGEVEINPEQKQLTEDALKRLSALPRFQPAEVDYSIKSTSHIDLIPHDESPSQNTQIPSTQSLTSADDIINFLNRPSSNSSDLLRINQNPQNLQNTQNTQSTQISQNSQNPQNLQRPQKLLKQASQSSTSLAKRPISNPSPAAKERTAQPSSNLLSATTSSQNLPNLSAPMSPGTKLSSIQPQDISSTSLQTLSDLKRPMYVPAVLRQSPTNLTQKDLQRINEQNSRKAKSVLTSAAASLKSQTSHWKLAFDASSTNLPTRAHWRRDLTRLTCAICDKQFTFFERRHHCRRCGDIFCAEHTSHLLKLGRDAQFTIGGSGVLCKVCDNCCKDYERFVKHKFGDADTRAINGKTIEASYKNGEDHRMTIVDNSTTGSVPADWSWSSF